MLGRGQVDAGAVASSKAGCGEAQLFTLDACREASDHDDDVRLAGGSDGVVARVAGKAPDEALVATAAPLEGFDLDRVRALGLEAHLSAGCRGRIALGPVVGDELVIDPDAIALVGDESELILPVSGAVSVPVQRTDVLLRSLHASSAGPVSVRMGAPVSSGLSKCSARRPRVEHVASVQRTATGMGVSIGPVRPIPWAWMILDCGKRRADALEHGDRLRWSPVIVADQRLDAVCVRADDGDRSGGCL